MAVAEGTRCSVVWEWMDERFAWRPYSSDICQALERVRSKGLKSAQLGDVDPFLACYTVNVINLSQLREDTGTCRPVRRHLYPSSWPPGLGISWQWSENTYKGIWSPYEICKQNAIEIAFQKGTSCVDLVEVDGKSPYVIEFDTMSQVRRKSGKRRGIRRQIIAPYPWAANQDLDGLTPESGNDAIAEIPEISPQVHVATRSRSRHKPLASGTVVCEESCETEEKTMGKGLLKKIASLGNLKSKTSKKTRASAKKSVKSNVEENGESCEVTTLERVDGATDSRHTLLSKFTRIADVKVSEHCCICCTDLKLPSEYDNDATVVEFVQCKHMVHKACLTAMCDSSSLVDSIQCPICKQIYGEKRGNQPLGTMVHSVISTSLPGYPECGTIIVQYHIRSGIQGPEHPNPGQPYSARGFPRCCYIPDNEKGRKVLTLLKVAWERRLIFTVGTSVTTGELGTVTWNEIHHKTEFGSNYSGHGYPDENYLDNVLLELSLQGVVE